jgi:hypothetical protein
MHHCQIGFAQSAYAQLAGGSALDMLLMSMCDFAQACLRAEPGESDTHLESSFCAPSFQGPK